MNPHLLFRLAVDAVLAVCVLFGLWYIALPVGAIALFRFPYFMELTAAGFAYDALFGMNASSGNMSFIAAYAGTLSTAGISLAVAAIKGSVR
ncbi:MAG: hypothetical protein JWO00_16 [Candidatus Parcubacteria bacterium]|nr:hypothetical protein [Candidatus Parcubacteria bacterium]